MDNNIIIYLKQVKSLYDDNPNQKSGAEYYDWILREGKSFSQTQKPDEYGKQKLCYYNAQSLAMTGGVLYYEGWGITKAIGIPLEHGFTVRRNKVIDPTWRDGELYFGVNIPIEFVRKHWIETRMAKNLLYHYYLDLIQKEKICYK